MNSFKMFAVPVYQLGYIAVDSSSALMNANAEQTIHGLAIPPSCKPDGQEGVRPVIIPFVTQTRSKPISHPRWAYGYLLPPAQQ